MTWMQRKLFALICLVSVLAGAQSFRPPLLTIHLAGNLDARTRKVLLNHHATFRAIHRGFEIQADRPGRAALRYLAEFEELRGQLCLDNLCHAGDSLAQGYLRQFTVLQEDGSYIVETDQPSDAYKFVYDPTDPLAEHSGRYAGYVKFLNLNVLTEMQQYRHSRRMAAVYRGALSGLAEPG